VPLQEELRVGADTGEPLVVTDPDAPASQAIFHTARGLIAATPQEAPLMQQAAGFPVEVSGQALPMAQ
jgi:ATP-binding protein involved in chromosome partitioning